MDKRLHDAAVCKEVDSVKVIKVLFDQDSSLLEGKTPLGNTALHLAIKFGNHRFVRLINQLCPTLLEQTNMAHETPLHLVAACGEPNIWKWSFDVINSNKENQNFKRVIRRKNCQGETTLHVALKNCNGKLANYLLEADVQLSNYINKVGESIIYLAANFGCVDIVEKLLKEPSTFNHVGLLHQSPLHAAIQAGNIGISSS
jgi:ankyrin repeat protein